MNTRTHPSPSRSLTHQAVRTPSVRRWVQAPIALALLACCRDRDFRVRIILEHVARPLPRKRHRLLRCQHQGRAVHALPRRLQLPRPDRVPRRGSGGGFSIQSNINGSSEITVNGISVGGRAYKSAATICDLGAAAAAGGTLTGAQEQEMIAEAHCLRTHGIPDFADPSFGPGGRGIRFQPPAGYNAQAPAVRQAAKTCAAVGSAIPGAGAKG